MSNIEVDGDSLPIRSELVNAIEDAWERLVQPGTWFNGEQRRAIAIEARKATSCRLCEQRKQALSPYTVSGQHDSTGSLSEDAVEAVHRLRTDAGRITERWVQQMIDTSLDEEAYVEIIGIVAVLTALDTFDESLGRPLRELPLSQPGEPRRHRPPGAKRDLAWVTTLAPELAEANDPNPYPVHGKANIHRGLSLVPQEVFNFFDLDVELYLRDDQIPDYEGEHRAISRAQIELIAGRASAINNCTY